MPIYDQSYRSYDGAMRPRFRWVAMVRQELRVLLSRRMFIFLVLLGNLHFLLRVLQIFFLDVVSKQSYGFMADAISSVQFEDTGAWVYFDFLRMQSPLIFLTLIYAGAGLICNDFRNNLVEVYFAKPLTWRDYVTGKAMTLITIGLGLTALPALFLALLHLTFTPTMPALMESLRLAPAIIAFSLLTVGSFSLAILASSALVNSSRFASIAIFMLAFINLTVGILFALLMGEQNYLTLAYPVSLNHIGEMIFNEQRYDNPIDVAWPGPALYIAAVCGASLAIVSKKVRRAETGR